MEGNTMLEIELRPRIVPELPRQLYIEVTNHCNSLCVSCPLTFDHFLPLRAKTAPGLGRLPPHRGCRRR
jgi:MoaA/NifB/PqqE/SkfB family radical SAM enzyme